MKKYFIKLGSREYKFRVKDSGNYGNLVEVILDNESLEFLKSQCYRIVNLGEEVPEEVVEEKKEEQPEEVNKVEEVVQDIPKNTAPPEFTASQIKDIKEIKEKMKITTNEELNAFINEWTLGQQSSYKYLNEKNIEGFISFMTEQYLS